MLPVNRRLALCLVFLFVVPNLPAGDPRKSIAECYPDREAYLGQFARAADELIRQRWILPEDRAPLLQRGGEEWGSLAP